MKLKTKIQDKDVRIKVMNALARREHSEKEIYLKFISLVESKNKLLEEINKLKEEGLLSDDRFAEAYIKSRYYSGFGPVRIQYELEKKGVLQNKIENAFQETGLDWDSKLEKERIKEFSNKEFQDICFNKNKKDCNDSKLCYFQKNDTDDKCIKKTSNIPFPKLCIPKHELNRNVCSNDDKYNNFTLRNIYHKI